MATITQNKSRDFLKIQIPWTSAALFVFLLAGLFWASRYNYLLFHSLAEMFSIVVAFAIFTITWSSRRFLDDAFFVVMGCAYLFISGLDLLHTLSYKGMGVFEKFDANLPTQLWIAARYYEALAFLIGIFLVEKRVDIYRVLGICALVFIILIGAIFYWDFFPVCYVEGVGLTRFKKNSEYVICAILLMGGCRLFIKRRKFGKSVSPQLMASVLFTIFAELSFTFYVGVFDISNLVGHYFKIVSYYFVYKSIVETGINQPVDRLFKSLRESERNFKRTFDQSPLAAAIVSLDYSMLRVNGRLCAMSGYTAGTLINMDFKELIHPEDRDGFLRMMRELADGKLESCEKELRWVKAGDSVWWGRLFARLVRDESDAPLYFLPMIDDIEEERKAAEKIKTSLKEKELLIKEVHHRVKNNMAVVSSMLSVQSARLTDETCKKVLMESKNRIHSMALVHENLYLSEDLTRVDFFSYVRNLVRHLLRSGEEVTDQIEVVEDIEKVDLGIDLAIPCGLVLTELISNCLEHAFKKDKPGKIRIMIRKSASGKIEAGVADNGVGIAEDFDMNAISTMGLRLVKGIVEHQLGGKLYVTVKDGTEVRFVF